MTLRARLTLFFAGIVVLPLLAATLLLQALVSQEIERRSNTRLETAAEAAGLLWAERLEVAQREVRRTAETVAAVVEGPLLDQSVEAARAEAALDFLVVTNVGGGVVAASLGPAEFRPGIDAPTAFDVSSEDGSPAVLRARAELAGGQLGTVSGGWYLDAGFLRDLELGRGSGAMLVADGRVIASTIVPAPRPPTTAAEPVPLGGGLRGLVATIRGQSGELVLVVPEEAGSGFGPLWGVALLGFLLATVLGYMLAGVIVRPVHRLTEAAREVSSGNLETRIDIGERGEVGRLAEAFNLMTDNLRGYIRELESSRDELRRGLDRLGTALQSTLDLEGMLGNVVETAAATLGADAGAAFLVDPSGRKLRLLSAQGFEPPAGATVRVGRGIAGRAASGRPVLVPSRMEDPPRSAAVEPAAETAVAVPLRRGERMIGVLALYGRNLPEPFDEGDVATLGSLAAQASVAIENVLLHEETQRLSITDGLTGLWNRRYLAMVLQKEVERAQRFGRPLSLLMIDIDRFKDINDRQGHLAGDEVLVEVARRLTDSVRGHVDVVARYGGEEFVAVLPETGRDGAHVVAEKVRSAIAERPIGEDGGEAAVTVSIGVASHPHAGATPERLLRSADEAMYRAKQAGRNRVEVANGSAAFARSPRETTL